MKTLVKIISISTVIMALTAVILSKRGIKSFSRPTESETVVYLPLTPSLPNPNRGSFKSYKVKTIELKAANTLVLREVVSEQSIAKLSSKLLALSKDLPPDAVIYLVLDTPGGEISAGTRFIDTVHGLPQKVKTITLFAASMGYHIAQELDERMITEHGTLMSHRAKASGMEGEVPGNAVTRLNAMLRSLDVMDNKIAKRIGISLDAYKEMIRDEYWVDGADAVDQRSADSLANIHCAEDLSGTEDLEVLTLFGPVTVTFSKCPAISGILDVKLGKSISPEKQKEARELVTKMFEDKESFVRSYIITGKFNQVLK